MRNPDRLVEIYHTMLIAHESKVPDWRCMQLLINFLDWHKSSYGTDGFYIEDDEFLKRFKKFCKDNFLED